MTFLRSVFRRDDGFEPVERIGPMPLLAFEHEPTGCSARRAMHHADWRSMRFLDQAVHAPVT